MSFHATRAPEAVVFAILRYALRHYELPYYVLDDPLDAVQQARMLYLAVACGQRLLHVTGQQQKCACRWV